MCVSRGIFAVKCTQSKWNFFYLSVVIGMKGSQEMEYFAKELFDAEGNSEGWFVFTPSGVCVSGPHCEADAHDYAAALNRGEDIQRPPYLIENSAPSSKIPG